MYDKIRQKIIRAAEAPNGPKVLCIVSFAESSFFPIPPDLLLIPLILKRPHSWLLLSILCTLSSVLGGVLGYVIGYLMIDTIGNWLMQSYGLENGFHEFQTLFREYGTLIILAKGLTPIPYKLITLASGAAHFPIIEFIGLSLLTRALRFLGIAVAMRFLTPNARMYVEKNIIPISLLIILVAVLGSSIALKLF